MPLHYYDVHLNSGRDDEAQAVRQSQLNQLTNFMDAYSTGMSAFISITRALSHNTLPAVSADVALGCLGGATAGFFVGTALASYEEGPPLSYPLVGALTGTAMLLLLDSKDGQFRDLTPAWIRVTLTKVEGEPRPTVIHLDAAQLSGLRWIAIECAENRFD
jgi:hypothetical protein